MNLLRQIMLERRGGDILTNDERGECDIQG